MQEHEQDRIQRALNEAKKKELSERYGGLFHASNPNLPPQVESDWLHDIEEFERQFEAARETTVREYIGNPIFTPLANVPPQQLQAELDRILEYLQEHQVEIDCRPSVPPQELYRFITEELLDELIDDVHVEGMSSIFMYDHFHPDDREDAMYAARTFLEDAYVRKLPPEHHFASDGEPLGDGRTVHHELLRDYLAAVSKDCASFLRCDVTVEECTVTNSLAQVSAWVDWEGIDQSTMVLRKGRTEHALTLLNIVPCWYVALAAMGKPESGGAL